MVAGDRAGMEHSRSAEHALVAALVLGAADPRDLSGRLRPSDFIDPAAGVLFEVALQASRSARSLAEGLPVLLREGGRLRSDGYPVSELLEWLPRVPSPAHPQAWATLVVAGAIGRQVRASGDRLQQSAVAALEGRCSPGQLLATVAAQRAVVASGCRRWQQLPAHWRATLPVAPVVALEAAPTAAPGLTGVDEETLGRERALLAGVVSAPAVLGRIPWLREQDFAYGACCEVFRAARRLHEFGHPVDVVTLTAACRPLPQAAGSDGSAELAAGLRPELAFATSVPFLARRVLGNAICREVASAGADLIRYAQAPAGSGGVGEPLLSAARQRLDALQPYAVRWESATGELPSLPVGGSARFSRVEVERRAPPAEPPAVRGRCAG
ncbi:MAG: uncharacterized protein JWN57_2279 [Frankiales bacterium]|jgi:replicative DNA helicase|nr:uncharacterized protein [Frankiales bacterium]